MEAERMMSLIIFCAIGAGLFLLLLLAMVRRPSRPEGSANALLGARHALRALQVSVLPAEVVERFLARDDLNYVLAAAPVSIQQLFLQERKRIVLAWITQVRQQITNLQDFHFGHSRHFVHMSLTTEIGLAWEFAVLRMECRALYLLVVLRGPYGAPLIAGKMAAAAARLCSISEESLAFLAPAEGRAIPDDSARGDAHV
jgi:hypothetical protein